MINTQTLVNFPVFGDNATKAQPDNAKYAAGFQPADVYPAEWVNWVWNKASGGVTALNAGVNMMEREINNVLDGADKTPDATKDNQLLEAIQKLISDAETRAKLAAHPVGSLYWSSQSTDPATLFGGTWARVKDRFILAAGDTYTNGNTGGAATVTLQTTQIPSHNHGMNNHTHSFTPSGSISGGAYKFTGTQATLSATQGGTISGGAYKFTGTAATLKATAGGTISGGAYKFTGTANQSISVSGANHHHRILSYNQERQTIAYVYANRPVASNVAISSSAYADVANDSITTKQFIEDSGNLTSTGTFTATGAISVTTNPTFTGSEHSHSYTPAGTISVTTNPTFTGSSHSHTYTPAGSVSVTTNPSFTGSAGTTGQATGNTGSTGGGNAHENMPPYKVYYCWERVS